MLPRRPPVKRSLPPAPRSGPARSLQLRTVARIGQGAFGEVFLCARAAGKAQRQQLARNNGDALVAVKRVDKSRLSGDEQLKQLAVEVAVLRAVSRGRFVVGFEWAHETETHMYICTEFCPGGDLFTLTENSTLTASCCALILAQIAIALNFLHRNNIVYRDMKPENVALSRTGHVRLLDFGLAAVLREEDRNPENGRLEICSGSGTLAYTAPEVLQRVPHSFEADWWGLGMLAYEMFTGELPFHADDRVEHCAQICHGPLDLSEHFEPGSSEAAFVGGLLQRKRPQRLGYELDKFEEDILDHEVFQDVDWVALENETQRLPYAPPLRGPLDLSNFYDANLSR